MFIFGHLGLTLGAAILASGALNMLQKQKSEPSSPSAGADPEGSASATRESASSFSVWTARLGKFLDIRVLLLGALISDIIDKPLGHLFFESTFHNGRIFSHTLVFFLALFLPGLWLYLKRKKSWLLALAIGVFAHLVLDLMWLEPQTLFWPFYGWDFPEYYLPNILGRWLTVLRRNPEVAIPELLGAVITGLFFLGLYRRKQLFRFITRGKV